MMRKTNDDWWLLLTIGCALILSVGNMHPAVGQEVGSREIRSELVAPRIKPPTMSVPSSSRRVTTPRKRKRRVTYRPLQTFVEGPAQKGMEFANVGVTIWKLQDGLKDLSQEGVEAQTLQQVEADTSLAVGAHVRIGIEPLSRDGYLYVIDREQFADGTFGEARLIFPTLRTRKGNNYVKANELIYIPMPPSYFRISPSGTGKMQVAELLTILLSPTPLELPAPIGDKALVISTMQFNEWEKLWGAQASRLEMVGGAGQTTSVKAQAEASKSLDQEGEEAGPLTQDDPLPQTVYRAAIKVGSPLLVTLSLRFKAVQ